MDLGRTSPSTSNCPQELVVDFEADDDSELGSGSFAPSAQVHLLQLPRRAPFFSDSFTGSRLAVMLSS